jgi:hypothetical protein
VTDPLERFNAFTPEQARQLAGERNRLEHLIAYWWKRIVLGVAILLIGLALGVVAAVHEIDDARAHGDRANALAAAVNRRLIHDADQRAADAKAAAAKSARTNYATCRHQQESTVISREFFDLLKPALLAHNLPRDVAQFFADLAAQHAFDVPKCVKPPKGS